MCLLYANMMIAWTHHFNQHTLTKKALPRQAFLSIENLMYNHLEVCFNGANEYMMKKILYTWRDSVSCKQLLRNIGIDDGLFQLRKTRFKNLAHIPQTQSP